MLYLVDLHGPIRMAAIEAPSYGSKGQIAQLGGVHWVLRLELRDLGIPSFDVAPSQLKKALTGNGKADKMEVLGYARRLCPDLSTDDEADAFALSAIARIVYYVKQNTLVGTSILALPTYAKELAGRVVMCGG